VLAGFLRPPKIKLVFLVEWSLYILIIAIQGGLGTSHQILIAVYPLTLFYLVGCGFSALSVRTQQVARGWKLAAFALILALLDQVSKTVIVAFVPLQTSIPIIDNWLHLSHVQNPYGSWITNAFNLKTGGAFIALLWLMVFVILISSLIVHRSYTTNHRKSLWADVAFLGLFAGCASWIFDMAFRGHIIDFINLPGLMSADFKDIYFHISIAAVFAEAIDNPDYPDDGSDSTREGENIPN
jgi:lipoprotein signal peptidase